MKSRVGRPPIPKELRGLIRRMGRENVPWGEERIANELLFKLGIRISPRTVRQYLPKRPPSQPREDQRWSSVQAGWTPSGRSTARPKSTCRHA
jgi:putative transposase